MLPFILVVLPSHRGVSRAFANGMGPARMAVVFTPPLLAQGCWVCLRLCRQRQQRWLSRRITLCFLVASGAGDDGVVPAFVGSLLPSGRHCQVVVIVNVVLGTLLSSWRALAGAGYLLRGGVWSVVDVAAGRWVLTCTWYPSFSLLLVAVGCCSRHCGCHPFPGGRGGGVVEGSG